MEEGRELKKSIEIVGLWLGVWVLFIGGIVTALEAFKAIPIDSMGVAWGIVKVMNISPSAVVNAVIARLSEIEVREVMTFKVEIRSEEKTPGRVVRIRRDGGFKMTF